MCPFVLSHCQWRRVLYIFGPVQKYLVDLEGLDAPYIQESLEKDTPGGLVKTLMAMSPLSPKASVQQPGATTGYRCVEPELEDSHGQ